MLRSCPGLPCFSRITPKPLMTRSRQLFVATPPAQGSVRALHLPGRRNLLPFPGCVWGSHTSTSSHVLFLQPGAPSSSPFTFFASLTCSQFLALPTPPPRSLSPSPPHAAPPPSQSGVLSLVFPTSLGTPLPQDFPRQLVTVCFPTVWGHLSIP